MKAYIQTTEDNLKNINNQSAVFGFEQKGYEVIRFHYKELGDLPITRETIVVGGITVVKKVLNILGCQPVFAEDYPECLRKYLGRKIWQSTLKEARQFEPPVFIKPTKADQKIFVGFVLNHFSDLIDSAGVDENIPVLCAEPVHFISEYRVFVACREVLGIKHYMGDFRVFPDFKVIDQAIWDYRNSPVAYGIDFGVTDKGETLLIECNDGFALGAYGLSPGLYSYLLEKRWEEMTK